jgi:cytochrome c biogenesis factor
MLPGLANDAPVEARASWPVTFWRLATSPVTFVVLSLLWSLDLAVGSIVAYRNDPQFWMKMDAYPFNLWLEQVAPRTFPQSLWVYILVALTYLVVLSLALCTVNWFLRRRKRMRGMGEVLIHLGFLLVFIGFVLGSSSGARRQGIGVAEGTTVPLPELVAGQDLRLTVDAVEVVRGPDGQTLDTVSEVTLSTEEEEIASGTVRTNHPLIRGTTVVYPRGTQARVLAGRVATSQTGLLSLRPGDEVPLPRGGSIAVKGVLHPGERRGSWVGPGIYVAHLGADGRERAGRLLFPAMQGPVDLAGLRVTLVDLKQQTFGVYDVHRDPGVQLVLAGAIILALGTLWALVGYLRVGPATRPSPL